jgi:RNA binding exosome subunit
MKRLPVRRIDGEVFAYESEDLEKVKKAFEVFFPKKSMSQEKVSGGFGTTITVLRAELSDKKARELAVKALSSLSKEEKELVLSKLKLYVNEEGKFFLRFDKQLAYEKGKIKLTSEEESSIQVTFSLESYPASHEGYMKSAETLLHT